MPSKSETRRRKALVDALAQRKRAQAEAAMPLSKAALAGLFDHLDVALGAGCDHSLRFTRGYLQAHGLPEAVILPWLLDHGGGCDCEVLGNVEDAWGPT